MTAGGRPSTPITRQRLVQYFFIGVFLLVLWELLRLMSPFYIAVLGSAILALMVHPLHAWVRACVKGEGLAAGLTTTLAVLLLVVPCMLFAWGFLKDAARLYPDARDWFEGLRHLDGGDLPLPSGALDGGRRLLKTLHINPEEILLKNLDELRGDVTQLATAALANVVFLLFNFALLAFTLFFFLRDGEAILSRVVELVPMAPAHKAAILSRLQDTLIGLVRGVFGLAVVKGVLSGVGLAALGVPFPAVLATLTTLLSPIPALGVLAPVILAMALCASTAAGLVAAAWCLGVAVLVERVLRPLALGPQNEIPVLLLFFGLLGGVRVYGLIGILLGPVLIALTLAFINVYRQEYRWLLEPESGR